MSWMQAARKLAQQAARTPCAAEKRRTVAMSIRRAAFREAGTPMLVHDMDDEVLLRDVQARLQMAKHQNQMTRSMYRFLALGERTRSCSHCHKETHGCAARTFHATPDEVTRERPTWMAGGDIFFTLGVC